MTGPKPVQLPHVQQGNLLTDLSSGAGQFVEGLTNERERRRKAALDEALLAIRAMEASARLDRDAPRPFLSDSPFGPDPATGKPRPGVEHVLINPDGTYTRTGLPAVPPDQKRAAPWPWMVPVQTPTGEGVARVDRTTGGMDITAFPQGTRTATTGRQERNLSEPNPEQTQRVSQFSNMLRADRALKSILAESPDVANSSGFARVVSSIAPTEPIASLIEEMLTQGNLGPQEQRFLMRMRQYASTYLFATGGKQLTIYEARLLFPQMFGVGALSPEAQQEQAKIRNDLISAAYQAAGPEGVAQAVLLGEIDPADLGTKYLELVTYMKQRYNVTLPAVDPATLQGPRRSKYGYTLP